MEIVDKLEVGTKVLYARVPGTIIELDEDKRVYKVKLDNGAPLHRAPPLIVGVPFKSRYLSLPEVEDGVN